ncbi:MAG: tRNA (uridine(34)/cytosine(34)/5-carboxymethylaminomethyluridine(34)-2'-O)-methyltransferase TrmL [Betaproteobacteria bacterium]|jgi:tRNA (cytidine/uridine-2'-O-)-methyltransferase|nr:tRNA (uridine(34)/cytosine(34)/5-carboxymethylaminomethyluridine(34)-2'-O)-methyltransferase TrmL [Betaproteobacteria bacterium]
MLNVVLVEPEIPPNTGNIIRLCANTGVQLHLVEPLGFPIDDSKMRRAGLDYRERASFHVHASWQAFFATASPAPDRLFAITTKGQQSLFNHCFREEDWLVFGSETKGLGELLNQFPTAQRLRIPMRPDNRSLNLSNAVAIGVYEAWRQLDFDGAI